MKLNREFERLQRHIEKMTRHRETTVARNHRKVLDDLRFRLAKIYESYEINGQLTYAEMLKYNRLQKLDKEIEAMIKDLYKTNDNLIKGHLTAIAKETYNKTIDIIEDAADREIKGVAKSFKVDKTVNEQMAGIEWPARMGKHRADVIWDIQKEIKQGLTQGDTYSTMAKRLKKELEVSNSKARTIIRTESARVHARAKEESLDAIAREGVRMEKTWLSSQDERVRSTHADMNGVTVPYDEDFELPGGYRAKGPMDDRLPPEEVINCRCLMTIELASPSTSVGKSVDSVDTIETEELKITKGNYKDVLVDDVGFRFVEDSYNRIDETLRVEITEQLYQLESKFNSIAQSDSTISAMASGRADAYVSSRVTDPSIQNLSLNPSTFRDRKSLIEQVSNEIKANWAMPAAKDRYADYIVTHEYGHIVQNLLVEKAYKEAGWVKSDARAFINYNRKTRPAQFRWYYDIRKEVQNTCYTEIIEIAKKNNKDFKLTDNLSRYGMADKAEFFAEVFANSQLGKPNELGKAMNTWLKGKGLMK